MSFQTRIEDYVGTLASADTTFMTDTLTAGARVVADYIVRKSSDKVDLYATDKTDTDGSTGIDVTGGVVISAHKSYYPARRIPVEMKAKALDGDSLHYAISTDPVWFIEKSKGYVLPGGGVLRHFVYPAVTYSDSTISNYPPSAIPAVVLYAAAQYSIRILSDLTTTTIGGISFTSPSLVVPPSSPSFTWTDAVAATVGMTQIGFTDELVFNPPVFTGSYTSMDTALTNQDIELGLGYNQKIQSQLNEYSQNIQKAVADFQKDLQTYQLGLQKAIENARLESQRLTQQAQITTDINLQNEINTLNEQIQEYQAQLAKYQGDISSYGTQIQKEASRIQSILGQYQLQSQNYLQILENLRKEFQLSLESL